MKLKVIKSAPRRNSDFGEFLRREKSPKSLFQRKKTKWRVFEARKVSKTA